MRVEWLILGLTLSFAVIAYGVMRARFVVVPSSLTRGFGWVMSAHALVNLIVRNLDDAARGWEPILATNVGCGVFLAAYLNVLRHHAEGPILAAVSLAFGSFAAFATLLALGQFPFSLRLTLYTTIFAGFTLFVAWRSARIRLPTAAR